MKIKVIAVGKLKEDFAKEGASEYKKRLSKYASVEITEVDDEKTKEGASAAEESITKAKEGARIIAKMCDTDYNIALSIDGKKYTSEAFASKLEGITTSGKSTVTFIVGGSIGLSDEVLKKCDEKLSFSDFTFPHQLMRVILLEQVYRAFRIIRNEPYHK